MKKITIKILVISLIINIISPFSIMLTKSFAASKNYKPYITTDEDENTLEKFKNKYAGHYEDVKLIKTEYKYTYQLEKEASISNKVYYGSYASYQEAQRRSPKVGEIVNRNQLSYKVLNTKIEEAGEQHITKGPYNTKTEANKEKSELITSGKGIYDADSSYVYLENNSGWWIVLYYNVYSVYFKGQTSAGTITEETSDWTTSSFSNYVQSLPSSKRSSVKKVISTKTRVTYDVIFKGGSFGDNKDDTQSSGDSEGSTGTGDNGNTGTTGGSTGTGDNGSSGTTGDNTGTGSNNSSEEDKIYTENLNVGDTLKFTANTWYLRNKEHKTIDKFLHNGNTFEILAIDGNYLNIKILSGENQGEETYIKYGQEAATNGYFVKVDVASVGNNGDMSDKSTQSVLKDAENLLYKIYSGYYNVIIDDNSDSNAENIKNMIKDYVNEIESGKSTLCEIIEKLIPEDKLNLEISDEEYLKRLYKAFTLVEEPTSDSDWNTLLQNEVKKSRAEALKSILTSKYPSEEVNFKALCAKYGINDENVIGDTITYVKENTNKENIEIFVKDLISKSNIKISDEDKINLIDNIVSGQFSASTALKTIIESNGFKNLKLTDAEYIKVIGKICLNEDLSDSDIQNYENKLVTGTTRNELLKEFILNSKFQAICDSLKIERGDYTVSAIKSTGTLAGEFIKNAYTSLIGKDASNIGSFSNLVNGEQTATEAIQLYVDSAAFKNRKLSDEEYVKALFKATLNRTPSQDEINTYVNKIKESGKMTAIDEIVKTDEFKKICNQYYLTAGKYVEYVADSEKEQIQQEGNVQIIQKEKTTKDGKKVIYLEDVIFDLSGKTKGDVNGDKNVEIADATLVLTKAVALTLNDKLLTQDEATYVDIDSDGMITVKDAQYILTYYARKAADLNPSWDEVVSGNYSDENQETIDYNTDYNTDYKDGYLSKVSFGDNLYYTVSYNTVNGNEKVLNEVHEFRNNLDVSNERYNKNGTFADKQIRTYHSNGEIKSRTNYNSKNEKIYYWEYDDKGNRIKFEEYRDNKLLVYTEENYDETGKLKSTYFYDGVTNEKIETVEYNEKKVTVKKYSNIEYKYDSSFVWQVYDFNEVDNIKYEKDTNNAIYEKIEYYEDKVLQCIKVTKNGNVKYYNEKNEEITKEQFEQRRSNPIKKEEKEEKDEKVDTSNKITEITINNIKFKLKEPKESENNDNKASYKQNTEEELKNTGIEGIYTNGDKQYKVYCQSIGPWASKKYSYGTYASDAAGVTTIATTLSGYGINKTPEDVNNDGIVNIQTFTSELKNEFSKYGLICSDWYTSTDNVIENLKKGNPVIVHISNAKIGNTEYRMGHYAVLLGISDDGKIFFADSAAGGRNTGYYEKDEIFSGISKWVYISNSNDSSTSTDAR